MYVPTLQLSSDQTVHWDPDASSNPSRTYQEFLFFPDSLSGALSFRDEAHSRSKSIFASGEIAWALHRLNEMKGMSNSEVLSFKLTHAPVCMHIQAILHSEEVLKKKLLKLWRSRTRERTRHHNNEVCNVLLPAHYSIMAHIISLVYIKQGGSHCLECHGLLLYQLSYTYYSTFEVL